MTSYFILHRSCPHMTNEAFYQDLPRQSEVARDRRLKLAGHCVRPRKSYIDMLVEDANLAVEDLPNTMRQTNVNGSV